MIYSRLYARFCRDVFPLLLYADGRANSKFVHAEWAPGDHALVVVYEYDIYYVREPRSNTTFRVTNDAIPGQIYNGVTDWLYEGKYIQSYSFVKPYKGVIILFLESQQQFCIYATKMS